MKKDVRGAPIKRNSRKKSIRLIAVIACCVLLLLSFAFSVYAAFLGKGSTKGVLIGGRNYFDSNVLMGMSTILSARTVQINCSDNSQNIRITNYDVSNGYCNPFSITYRVYCWLSQETTNSDLFTYYVTIGGTTTAVTGTTPQTGVITSDILLAGRAQRTNSFSVGFIPKDAANTEKYADCGICIAVVPITPGFMVKRILGGTITKSYSVFSVQGSFLDTEETIENTAGFLYDVLSSGVPEEGQTITLTWDAAKLEFDPSNDYLKLGYQQGIEITVDGYTQRIDSITYTPTEDHRYFSVAFFRETDNDFWQAATWSDVQALVSIQINHE